MEAWLTDLASSLIPTVNRFLNCAVAFLLIILPLFFDLFCFSGIRFDLSSYLSLELVRYFFTIKLGNILLSFILVVGLHYQVCIIVIVIWVTSTQGSCFSVLCIRVIVSLLKYSFKTQSCISYWLFWRFFCLVLHCSRNIGSMIKLLYWGSYSCLIFLFFLFWKLWSLFWKDVFTCLQLICCGF